jgi:hypothetical protein
MTRLLRTVTLVAVLALSLVACGDDDSIGGLPGDAGNLPGDVGDIPGDIGDLPGNIPGLSDECQAYASLSFAMSGAFSGSFDGLDGGIVANLPAEAQADGAIVVAALQDFSDGLDELGIDLSQGMGNLSQEQVQAFSELGESTLTDEVNDAFDRIGELASATCAVEG